MKSIMKIRTKQQFSEGMGHAEPGDRRDRKHSRKNREAMVTASPKKLRELLNLSNTEKLFHG
jgi:hypothetical protein